MTAETQTFSELPVSYEWVQQTTYARERFVRDYVLALGMSPEDLDGRVLDLGSGAMQYFNAELKDRGVEVDITSVNPDMVEGRFRDELADSSGFEGKTIAAIGQQLPFQDESFDRVLSLGAVTMYAGPDIAPKPSVQAWMAETVRVLKKDGTARLGPIYGEEFLEDYNSYFDDMQLDASLEIEPVVDDNGMQLETEEENPHRLYRLVITK